MRGLGELQEVEGVLGRKEEGVGEGLEGGGVSRRDVSKVVSGGQTGEG